MPGFSSPRALSLLERIAGCQEGAAAEEIEAAPAFGMLLGAGRVRLIGIDTRSTRGGVCGCVSRPHRASHSSRLFKPALGQKKGVGFYVYRAASPPHIDPDWRVSSSLRAQSQALQPATTHHASDPSHAARGTRAIEEGIVRDPPMSIWRHPWSGIPAAKGGLLFWRLRGRRGDLEMLEPWAYLGPAPRPALLSRWLARRTFYAGAMIGRIGRIRRIRRIRQIGPIGLIGLIGRINPTHPAPTSHPLDSRVRAATLRRSR